VGHKARRITLLFESATKQEERLIFTFRQDLSFDLKRKISREPGSKPEAKELFKKAKETNKVILVPAIRDTGSAEFVELLSKRLDEHGIANLLPREVGGTTREYRALKDIGRKIGETVAPFIDKKLTPLISKGLGIKVENELSIEFRPDVFAVSRWIRDDLRLAIRSASEEPESTVPLSESGTGIQSAVLLALRRLALAAQKEPSTEVFLFIEEPEAFLHPQKQKELFEDTKSIGTGGLKIYFTTHSPYIVSETRFAEIGIVRRKGKYSTVV
jgi:putative ATP-dependent endonuclease of OLD family